MMKNNSTTQKGFTLFLSIVITATLLLVATGVVTLAIRQSYIASAGKESQHAFYAADTGMECALYWDIHNSAGVSAFATSSGYTINCNYTASNPDNRWVVGGSSMSTFGPITFSPDPYCATVTVTKNANGTTLIQSRGYNTCDTSNPRRVERAVQATY